MIGLRDNYLVIRCWLGVASAGAAGETANVSHEIQPDGRLARAMSAPATQSDGRCRTAEPTSNS
jgi:hypothetical protein